MGGTWMTQDDCLCEYQYDFWVECTARLGTLCGFVLLVSTLGTVVSLSICEITDTWNMTHFPPPIALFMFAMMFLFCTSGPLFGIMFLLNDHLFDKHETRYWQVWLARQKQK